MKRFTLTVAATLIAAPMAFAQQVNTQAEIYDVLIDDDNSNQQLLLTKENDTGLTPRAAQIHRSIIASEDGNSNAALAAQDIASTTDGPVNARAARIFERLEEAEGSDGDS